MSDLSKELAKAVLIFGLPGSGKGTICSLIEKIFPVVRISTGDVIRDLVNSKKYTKNNIDLGSAKLWSDDEVNQILKDHIATIDLKEKTLLLDGFPRTKNQSIFLRTICAVKKIIILETDHEICIKRILNRSKTSNRKDDLETEVIKERIEIYENNKQDVISNFDSSIIAKVDGNKNVVSVLGQALINLEDVII